MYQFYYADGSKIQNQPVYQKNLKTEYEVTAVRPTMWEEHCLECSAPACFSSCTHYIPRGDGRCMRFANGLFVYDNEKGCCNQGVRVKYRKWANMMTIIYPAMLSVEDYLSLTKKNRRLGNRLQKTAQSRLPVKIKWESIRTQEFLRRRKLKSIEGLDNTPDAFVLHGYSFENKPFHLIVEVYDSHTPVFKQSLLIKPGENMEIIDGSQLSEACATKDFRVKIYPENDIEAELDILWCDFVKGKRMVSEKPAAKVKCVVWDLDNTLWNGTLVETENPDSIELNPGVADTVKALDERGIIQSIASKNDYELAWETVKRIGLSDYFIYPQIHWNAKSGSLEQIAKNLNIGIDTFAFIDDAAFERNQVHSVLPQVRIYAETDIQGLLSRPEFDVPVTEDSRNRRLMYKAEEQRHTLLQSGNVDTADFIRQCHLQIELFTPATDDELLRCYELVVRTNQLNLSGIKYTREAFNEVLHRDGCHNLAFSCQDDFGSYGIVGFLQYRIERGVMVFTEFAMSCRVAGKFVESALFAALLDAEACQNGIFVVNKTKKNILLRNSLQNIGFVIQEENDERISYRFNHSLENKDIVIVKTR